MKTRVILPTTYAALFTAALVVMFAHSGNAWCAVYPVELTAPWILFVSAASDAISPALMESPIGWHLMLVLCAGLNTLCFFLIGKGIDSIWTRLRKKTA